MNQEGEKRGKKGKQSRWLETDGEKNPQLGKGKENEEKVRRRKARKSNIERVGPGQLNN
jgi:hypothetical protein